MFTTQLKYTKLICLQKISNKLSLPENKWNDNIIYYAGLWVVYLNSFTEDTHFLMIIEDTQAHSKQICDDWR